MDTRTPTQSEVRAFELYYAGSNDLNVAMVVAMYYPIYENWVTNRAEG